MSALLKELRKERGSCRAVRGISSFGKPQSLQVEPPNPFIPFVESLYGSLAPRSIPFWNPFFGIPRAPGNPFWGSQGSIALPRRISVMFLWDPFCGLQRNPCNFEENAFIFKMRSTVKERGHDPRNSCYLSFGYFLERAYMFSIRFENALLLGMPYC